MKTRLAPAHRRRAAVSLVEMVVTITIGSSLMLTAVAIVQRAMDYRQQTQHRLDSQRSVDRELIELRRSVAEANRLDCPSNRELRIQLHQNNSINYRADGDRLIKQTLRDGAVESTHTFTLGDQRQMTFQLAKRDTQVIVRLIRVPLQGEVEPIVERQVLAVSGVLPAQSRGQITLAENRPAEGSQAEASNENE